MTVRVRTLKAKDVRMVVAVLGKELPPLLEGAKPDETKEERANRISRNMATALLENHLDTIWEWVADLGEMTAEELDEAAAHVPFEILTRVMTGQSAMDFFEHAQRSMEQVKVTIEKRKHGTG